MDAYSKYLLTARVSIEQLGSSGYFSTQGMDSPAHIIKLNLQCTLKSLHDTHK